VLGDGEMLARVGKLADGAGMQVKLTTGNASDPAAVFGEEIFDAVYCPWGTLDWLEAFDTWAESVANVLKPAGRLVLYDRHPISSVGAAHKGLFVVGKSYFGDHDPKGHGWTLGDLISSLGAEGLATMLFDEFPDADRFRAAGRPRDPLGYPLEAAGGDAAGGHPRALTVRRSSCGSACT